MLCGDTQSTKHMQGIQSVVVAPGFCLPEQAYLPPFSPMLSLCSPTNWKEGLILSLHTFPVPEHTLSLAWNALPSAMPPTHLNQVNPFFLVPTLSLALISIPEIIIFQLLVYLPGILTSLRTP